MSEEITVTIPKIDETLITEIETLAIKAEHAEAEALKALREKYSVLARQNGYVKLAYRYDGNSNYSREDEAYYEKDGKKVHALLAVDCFTRRNHAWDQNRGEYTGSRLYLTQNAEWLEIVREGSWSQWQGEGEGWNCGMLAGQHDDDEYDYYESQGESVGGSCDVVTDDYVASEYNFADILDGLSKALKTMATKLPERMARLQERATLASQLLAALK